jgi:hypothetical protein
MPSLLTSYVRRFNGIHRQKGHLFQGRYRASMCDRNSYLLELVRYIHLNPQRDKMVTAWAMAVDGHGLLKSALSWIDEPSFVMEERETLKAMKHPFARELNNRKAATEWNRPTSRAGRGRTRLLGKLRGRFIHAAVLEQGY